MTSKRDSFVCLSRRAFVTGSAVSFGTALLEPNLFAADPPPTPPTSPSLSGDDIISRNTTQFVVTYAAVPGATSYDFRLKWRGSQQKLLQSVSVPPLIIGQLSPNRVYTVSYRAVGSGGSSDWSPPVNICTRLPQPPSPQLSPSTMINLALSVKWDVGLFLSGLNDSSKVTVVLAKDDIDGALITLQNDAKQVGYYVDGFPALHATYRIQLRCPEAGAPDGMNLSSWSEPLKVNHTVFSELRVPSVQESQRLAIRRLTRRYR